jgi:hypothetical protein
VINRRDKTKERRIGVDEGGIRSEASLIPDGTVALHTEERTSKGETMAGQLPSQRLSPPMPVSAPGQCKAVRSPHDSIELVTRAS